MSLSKRKLKTDPTTGFGVRSTETGSRFYRKDGTVNVVRKGVPFLSRFSWFHTMLSISRWRFYAILWTAYIIINFFFAIVYYEIGVDHLGGIKTSSPLGNFAEAYFFSAQTFTTVGYGRISPEGFTASAIAAFEAFVGLLAFALASGLFYGRFAKPKPYLFFSDIALLSPYKDGKALMFRAVPYKNNHLTDAEVKLTLGMRTKENEEEKNLFYPLEVEFNRINSFVLNWTIVHPLTEESPLYGLTLDEMIEAKVELLVFIKAYDEVFANSVIARTSYIAREFVDNAKFKPMYRSSQSGKATILHVDDLNEFELLELKS